MPNIDASLRTSPDSRYRRYGVDVYPHPYFDPSSWYIPPTIREMFRWTQYLFLTSSTIGPVIRKKASYILTDLIYSTSDSSVKDIWKRLLETTLKLREFEYKMLLDYDTYGNAFCSIIYPFERYLKCPYCEYENLLRSLKWRADWEYTGAHFVAKCKHCKARTAMEIIDRPIRNRSRIRLHRWYPQYILPRYNPMTGNTSYILQIPKWMKTRVRDAKINRVYVEDTPKEILEAIRDHKIIELDPDNIFHMKMESISTEDESLGIPQMLNIIKDAWLHQTYRKANEAVALDHILPMTMVSPAPAAGTNIAPHINIDLGSWRGKMQGMITQWRRDPNAIFPVPFPVQVSHVRGDAQALSLHNDIQQVRQQIAGGLDVPPDFLYGNLTWSGGNVTLRVLENLLIGRLSYINSFLSEWLLPRLRRFLGLPQCDIHHTDFKMADDIQQKQIAMNLRTTNTISDQTTIEELGFNKAREDKRRREEFDMRIQEMEKQQIAQAEIQAKVMVIQARAQIEVNRLNQRAQMEDQQAMMAQQQAEASQQEQATAAGYPAPPMPAGQYGAQEQPQQEQPQPAVQEQREPMQVLPPTLTVGGSVMSPQVLDLMVNSFMKTTPPHEIMYQLNVIKESNPVFARAVEERMREMKQQAQALMRPLPEERPPMRSPETAVI